MTPPQKPLGMSDFFALEAGEYLERLDGLLVKDDGSSGDEIVRLALPRKARARPTISSPLEPSFSTACWSRMTAPAATRLCGSRGPCGAARSWRTSRRLPGSPR